MLLNKFRGSVMALVVHYVGLNRCSEMALGAVSMVQSTAQE